MVIEAIDFYGLSPEDIIKYLPGKDCGGCGCADCMAFANELSKGTMKAESCPELAIRMMESLGGPLSIRLEVREADYSMSVIPETLIEINSPTADSPVIVTGNCTVTHYVLKLIFRNAPDVSLWIVPTDTKGFTIDHAAIMRVMTPATIMKGITTSGIANKVNGRTIIIPGLCEGIERQVEMVTKWKTVVGPKSGFELPAYLTLGEYKD
eukprot:TRINITY_DN26952_c0_g1_i3.p1 TRINITY_DN26952_c0_g1~~TRINITY_DN26952_c0_g1_i3.p1  ORF type:complete len:209 (-),score=-13.82 TRINITY_DN26952_c0_g1_i3:835-1461(-)